MQFTNPYAFWALGFIPLLIIIHNLRSRRKQVDVTNLFLWCEVLSDYNRGIRIRRFMIRNLSLFLQILMVILSSLALAGPVTFYLSGQRADIIMLLDSSASMKAKTGSISRFDLARGKAMEIIDEIDQGCKMMVIEAGSKPVIATGFTEDKNELKKAIKRIEASDVPGKIRDAVLFAISFLEPGNKEKIILITDGAAGQLDEIGDLHQKIEPFLVGGGERNVGITKFQFRNKVSRDNNYEIMIEVRNFNAQPVICPLRLKIDRTVIYDKTIGFKPHEKILLIIPYYGLIAGRAEARLDIDDDFEVDNRAYSVLSDSEDIWVLLVSGDNYFLKALLGAYPNVLVNEISEIDPSSWERQVESNDIVIIDRTDFPSTQRGNFLLIDSLSPSMPLERTGLVNHPEIVDWDRKSPVMADLDMSHLHINEAALIRPGKALRPLMESRETGLIYEFKENDLQGIFIGFDITKSDLPLKVAFPVLMSNIIQWLHPGKLTFSTAVVKAGEIFPIKLAAGIKNFSVLPPSGDWEKYNHPGGIFIYKNTSRTGFYKIDEGDRKRYFAVNLMDESESDIGSPTIKEGNGATPEERTPVKMDDKHVSGERPFRGIFLILVFLVLLIEWYEWSKKR